VKTIHLVLELVFRGLEHVCDVMVAHDGGDALLKTIDDPPDVILSDYKMPGMDGRQLFDKLRGREKTRHIPFLFMAGRADIEERLRPLVDGVEEFIVKPFLVKDLVRITKKWSTACISKKCKSTRRVLASFRAASKK